MKPEYNTLNINQQKAVFTNKKKVLVMSGAGAGKTKVLTNRICYLLEHGALESQIVAFTFTNKAAREMKFRLNKMLERETTAFIGTFHSFCYSAIGYPENYYKLGFNNRPEIISDYEKSKIIKEILEKYNAKYSNIPFVQAISKIKNNVQVDDIKEEDILDNERSVNLGSVYESVVASELIAHDHKLFYYDNCKKGEVDYLIDDYDNLSVLPIEIKSGKDYQIHSAISAFTSNEEYKIKFGYVFSNERIIKRKDKIIYLPIYYIMFV